MPDVFLNADEVKLVIELMHHQARHSSAVIEGECLRFTPTFISDDGTDYVQAACDLITDLVHLRYEGTKSELQAFLNEDEPIEGLSTTINSAACDGLAPELSNRYYKED